MLDTLSHSQSSVLHLSHSQSSALQKRKLSLPFFWLSSDIISRIMNDNYYHTSIYDLYIGNSVIEGSGLGVFTKTPIKKNTLIDFYHGTLLDYYNGSEYLFEIDHKIYIDARDFPRCYMAMLNDASYRPTSKRALRKFKMHDYVNNCEFIVDKNKKEIQIWSIMDIEPNSELFLSYGAEYWNL